MLFPSKAKFKYISQARNERGSGEVAPAPAPHQKKRKLGPINQMQEVPRIIKLIYNKFQFMWHLPTE